MNEPQGQESARSNSRERESLRGRQEKLYYLYHPKNWERLIDREMADPDFQGVRVGVKYNNQGEQVSEGHLENPTNILATIRAGYLEAIRNQKIDPSVVGAIVTREIENYEELRDRLTKADLSSDPHNLASRVLIQEQLLFRLDKTGALSQEQKIQLAKKYPSLNVWTPKSMPVPTTAPENLPIVPTVTTLIKKLPPVSEKSQPPIQQLVKKVPPPRLEPQIEEPLLGLDWQDLLAAQAEEWGKLGHQVRSGAHKLGKKGVETSSQIGEKVKTVVGEINRKRAETTDELAWQLSRRLKTMDPRPIIGRTLRNPRIQRIALLGLLVSGSSGFKVEDKNIFSILATEAKNIPPAVASISAEMASQLTQVRSELNILSKQIATATGELATQMPTFEAQLKTAWENVANGLPTPIATVLPQRIEKAIPQPPATPEVSQLAPAKEVVAPVMTEAQLLEKFRTAEVPESPPGMVSIPIPAESEYSKYVIPGYKSQTGSPYMKGLDYSQFPWAGVGDVNNPEDVNRIPADAHAKNIRMVITGENDIPRLKAVVETAHSKGISVAVQFSMPELPKDKAKFTATIDRILSEANPDWLQFENEMGWLDKDGKPNQYYAGTHESIYKDYPAYVKIMQDEMKKSGNKTKLVIGSLGWDFFAHNAELDQFIKGLNSQGVDLDSVYFDIHVFDHLEGDWSSQANIARYREMAKLNGVKDPKFVSLEMYIGSDAPQTPEYVARALDVYKKDFGIDLLIAYPVTGDWMK